MFRRNEKYLEVRKLKVVIDLKNLEETLDEIVETELCPRNLSLKNSEACLRISCRDCWLNALKEVEVDE
ncbi:TPA: hypothetical protein ACF2C8_002862 [Clostridium perfringens]